MTNYVGAMAPLTAPSSAVALFLADANTWKVAVNKNVMLSWGIALAPQRSGLVSGVGTGGTTPTGPTVPTTGQIWPRRG